MIVLDNLDYASDFAKIMQLIPETRLCMVLITSRHRDARLLGICVEVTAMEADEAVELLLVRSNLAWDADHMDQAKVIVDRLAYLPLAVDQAGAYISSRNLPLDQFESHFTARKEAIMNYIPAAWSNQTSNLSAFKTWELSFQELASSIDDITPYVNLLTLGAFTHSSSLLPQMLQAQERADPSTRKKYIEAYTVMTHCISKTHLGCNSNLNTDQRADLYTLIVYCSVENGASRDTWQDVEAGVSQFSKSFVFALPSFGAYCIDCDQGKNGKALVDFFRVCAKVQDKSPVWSLTPELVVEGLITGSLL